MKSWEQRKSDCNSYFTILECSKKASISLQNCFLDIEKSLATYSLPATCNVFPVAIPGIFVQMQGSWSQRDSIPNNGCDGNQGGSSLEQDFLALFP